MQALVSIITPCYNSATFIGQTIRSVQQQSYPHWELIIVDDCSTDDSLARVEELAAAEPRLKIIKLAQNAGVSHARNCGIAAVQGKYIAFLDSDDIWLPEKLSKQLAFMEEQALTMSFTAYQRIDESGKIISRIISPPRQVGYKQLLWHNLIIFSTSMVLRSAIEGIHFKKAGHEDWIYWLDLFKKCGYGFGLNENLVQYRIRGGSVSSNKIKAAGYTWKILRENEKIGLVRSAYLFTKYAFATVWKRLK